jgi:hypothetical protein
MFKRMLMEKQWEKAFSRESIHFLTEEVFSVNNVNIHLHWIVCQKIKSKIKIFQAKIKKVKLKISQLIKHSNKIKKFFKLFQRKTKKLVK